MSDKELYFDETTIRNAVSNLLPNKVIFGFGDKNEVECASVWITRLENEKKILLDAIVNALRVLDTDDYPVSEGQDFLQNAIDKINR